MPGFLGYIGDAGDGFKKEFRSYLISEQKSGKFWFVERRTLDKFLLDKPFYEDEYFILLVEGVVLNRRTIEKRYGATSFTDAIITSYSKNGDTFFNEFRGSFSGLLFDKRKETWVIFTDHIGDKQVFYSEQNGNLIFGSEMGFLVEYCKSNSYALTLDEQAAYMLLTYGFFIEDHTIVNEIKKLNAGYYLRIKNQKVELIQYHRFTNEPDYSNSTEEFIEGIDHYFRNAVKLQFDKDLEYGYKHITTLSGGLDSRMTVWVAHDLGYTEMLNTTFSQSNYLDETIAKQIATDLKHEFLFKALDHGSFLKNIDSAARITYGGAVYLGMAHGKSLYDLLDFKPFGIMHTGQIGDAIIGTFYKKPEHGIKHKIGDGAYSIRLIERLNDYTFQYEYANVEIFSLYSRAFTGANQGLLAFQETTESISPFTDVDFLSFCYSIPVEKRFKHKIYIDWIFSKYPNAAEYPWEKTKRIIERIGEQQIVYIGGKKIPKNRIPQWFIGAVKRRILPPKKGKPWNCLDSAFHMNPFDYWYNENEDLKHYFDQYFQEHIARLPSDKLKTDCQFLYEQGVVTEKAQVLTLLSTLRLIA